MSHNLIFPDYYSHQQAEHFQRYTLLWALFIIAIFFIICLVVSCNPAPAHAETALQIAQSEIGHGETIANNQGKDIKRYNANGLPWCAAFISYCLKNSGYDLPYLLRAKSYLQAGQVISNPKPGDLIVFSRQGGGHIGIIEKIEDNKITTIEGNVGKFPSKVKRITYINKPKNIIGFVRLAKSK
jgi:uncharacterized protein (TIGR02594 family)